MSSGAGTKTFIKCSVKRCTMVLGTLLPVGSKSRILTYHSIGYRDHEMNVTPEAFAAQMEWLSEHFEVISLSDASQGKSGVAITFDDGYRDNLIHAAPVLKNHGMAGTVFVVAGKVGEMLEHDSIRETSILMGWPELRKWLAMGLSIGGHTMSHRRLSQLSDSEQEEEICGCSKILEEELGERFEAFAYPFGSALDYNMYSKALVKQAGYSYAVSNRYGTNTQNSDKYELRRIWIDRTDTMNTFKAKVDGRLDVLSVLDSSAGICVRRALNRLLCVK